MFYNFSFFAKPSMDFIQLWRDDRAFPKILCSTIPIPVHDLKIKVTDFEFVCVKSLQCQLLQSLWLIWMVFGMNEDSKMLQKGKACLRRAALSSDRSYIIKNWHNAIIYSVKLVPFSTNDFLVVSSDYWEHSWNCLQFHNSISVP